MEHVACRRLDRLPSASLPGGLRLFAANGFRARLLGLSRLDAIPAGSALCIPRCAAVHTYGMRFPLDLVWLDGAERVIRIDSAVAPGRHVSCRRARAVIETPAGDGALFAHAQRPVKPP